MPLLIDKRTGSGELAPALEALHLPVELCTLAYGDFALLGHGELDLPVAVGVERKTLTDFISSVISGRFHGHQLPGLASAYQEVWIVVEGAWRVSEAGLILVPCGKGPWEPLSVGYKQFMYRELEGLFLTLELKGGVRLRRTYNKLETCRFLSTLYHWWTEKEWSSHRSHLRFRTVDVDAAMLTKPTLARQVAALLPGIGWVRSGAVAAHFGSVQAMVAATEKDWKAVEGVGKTLAKRIVLSLKGEPLNACSTDTQLVTPAE